VTRTKDRRLRDVDDFRTPPSRPVPERVLSASQLEQFLDRFDPEGERLPLLHDLPARSRVSIANDGWRIHARLWRKGRVALIYSYKPGRIAEQVTVTFVQHRDVAA
jgi:hypothetical protein